MMPDQHSSKTKDLQLEEIWQRVVDPRIGIVRQVHETGGGADAPSLFIASAETAPPAFIRSNGTYSGSSIVAAGAGLTRQGALWSMMGEAVERYSASIFYRDELHRASFATLGDKAVNPASFIRYSPAQYARPGFPFRPPDPDRVIDWVQGTNLLSGESVYLPAQQVYFGYDGASQEGIAQNVTTGIACGPNWDFAVAAGLLEVIERDAFMSCWQLGLTPPELCLAEADWRTFPATIRALLASTKWSVSIRFLDSDIAVPTVLALVTACDRSRSAVGASAHPDLRRAITKAVIEAFHTWVWTRKLESDTLPDEADIKSFSDHVRYYLAAERQYGLDFLRVRAPSVERSLSRLRDLDPSEIVRLVLHSLNAAGFQAYAVDVTAGDIRSLGLTIVRVLVPGMQPLAAGTGMMPEDDRRLRQLTSRLGKIFPDRLNPNPHPFP
jgi:ribosomal protein S12 methylthiotransferase accessory factor